MPVSSTHRRAPSGFRAGWRGCADAVHRRRRADQGAGCRVERVFVVVAVTEVDGIVVDGRRRLDLFGQALRLGGLVKPDERSGGGVIGVELAEHVAHVDERLVERRIEGDRRRAIALVASIGAPVELERGARRENRLGRDAGVQRVPAMLDPIRETGRNVGRARRAAVRGDGHRLRERQGDRGRSGGGAGECRDPETTCFERGIPL